MVFTNKRLPFYSLSFGLLFVLSNNLFADYFSGLPTRDQNPLLSAYWIPHTIGPQKNDGVQMSTALFISNTLHDETNPQETLLIDGETYRFDINLQYQSNQWIYFTQTPYIASGPGFLDETIIDWHDTFGLPQGHRLSHQNNQIRYQYLRDGESIINQSQSFNGFADMTLGTTYKIKEQQDSIVIAGFGFNIPTGETNLLISNKNLEYAAWISYFDKQHTPYFFTLGQTYPSDSGLFEGILENSVLFFQTGLEYGLTDRAHIQLQLDYHTAFIQTQTKALGESLQMQFGLNLKNAWGNDIQLFFSEDILVGSAPDITFGLKIDWAL